MRAVIVIRRALAVLRTTRAQGFAIDALLGREVAIRTAKPRQKNPVGFDQIEGELSLALDALINAIDAYRERKGGRA